MDKGDAAPARAGAGSLVHEAKPKLAATGQRQVEVGDAVADVVDAGPPFGQEFGDGAFGLLGGEQLHLHVAESDGNNLGPIRCLWWGRLEAQHVAVEADGLGQVGDGYADVGDSSPGLGHGPSVGECAQVGPAADDRA